MAAVLNKRICNNWDKDILFARDFFQGVNVGKNGPLTPQLHKLVKPGDIVITPGQRSAGAYLLLGGRASLVCGSGAESLIDGSCGSDTPIFGVTELLADAGFDLRLTAATDCDVAIVEEEDLIALLRRRPDICLKLAATVGRAHLIAVQAIRDH